MTGDELRAALDEIGWTQELAARRLGVRSGKSRVNEWVNDRAPIPPYIEASVRAHLELHRCQTREAS